MAGRDAAAGGGVDAGAAVPAPDAAAPAPNADWRGECGSHASERLVDFVVECAGKNNLPDDFNFTDFKKRLFKTILATEQSQVQAGQKEFDRINNLVDTI